MESVVTASFYLLIKGIDGIYFHFVRHTFHKKFIFFETSDFQIWLKSARIHQLRGTASGDKDRLSLLMSLFSGNCSTMFAFFKYMQLIHGNS